MSSATILRHVSTQWIVIGSLFQGAFLMCIWFHLEILMTKTNITMTFPSLLHSPSRNMFTAFYAVIHLPRSLESAIAGNPSLNKASSHWKIQNQGMYLPINHHIVHIMLLEINGHYWVQVSHTGPNPKVFHQHTIECSNPFVVASNSCSRF